MSYLEEKIEQFRSLAANPQLTDEMIVAFLQELVHEGYGDSYPAMSIMDGLKSLDEED